MLSTDRLTEVVRGRGKDLITAGTDRVTGALRGHGKAAIFAGTALALAGAGSASAATASAATVGGTTADSAAHDMPLVAPPAHAPLTSPVPAAGLLDFSAVARPAAAVHTLQVVDGKRPAARASTLVAKVHDARTGVATWAAVSSKLNRQANPAAAAHGWTPAADQLAPVPTYGPQTTMPLSQQQVQNATTIVRQALAQRMGLRSAVVAVATAMQESKLLNIDYGTGASLGLFQQQVGMGWGSAQQIMNPVFASDAFLRALAQYQASNPGWARQPLWQAAQGVQASGFPTAYAQWEDQSVQLVKQIAMHVF
jgi:hypothetical protein